MPIDLICLVVFGFGFWQGFSRGIIRTVFNMLAYVFGIVLAWKMTPTAQNILEQVFNSDNPLMFVAAFVVNLAFIMLILRMAARSIEGVFNMAYLGIFNQVAGGVALGFFGVLLFSVLLWFGRKAQVLNQSTLSESRTYPMLEQLPPKALNVITRFRPLAEDFWDNSFKFMDRLEQYGVEKTQSKPKIYEVPDDGPGIEEEPETTGSGSAPEDTDGIEEE